MQKPNRFLALLSYLLVLIGPLILILFRRKDKFTLYHACQSLALVAGAVVVPLLWLAIGWTFAFLSVEFPVLYLAPIAIGLFMPVIRRRQHATRYKSRWSGLNILLTAVVAIALIYGSYLVIKWLAPVFLPLGGPLLLMAGFSIVIAAAIALVVAWLVGLTNALRAQLRPVPIYGGWGERLFTRLSS
ncbi:hypothetical protein [Caldilinea sp.]|uniref:hypothetical protein n=1 Tax=Caldilinea sp. TaxID=2293560 RepID=UPI002C895A5D|nr:hypothetical protein [Caldilinea sp.]